MQKHKEEKADEQIPLEFKARVVATAIKENLDDYQISERFGINTMVARNWMWSKDWILEFFCEQAEVERESRRADNSTRQRS